MSEPKCSACGKRFEDHSGVQDTCRKVLLLRASLEEIDRLLNDSDCEHEVVGEALGITWRTLKTVKD